MRSIASVKAPSKNQNESSDFDHALQRILIARNLPDSTYISDTDVARLVEGIPRQQYPRTGTIIKAWYHMGGAVMAGEITVNSSVAPTRYRVLRIEDTVRYPKRAVCCIKKNGDDL
jgi:hypothetical protein